MIKLTNVVKTFGKVEAVKGINLEVEKGSLFAFLGENGAGKSTTLSMICTESEPTSGEIFIDDEKLTFKNRKNFRQKLGVVFQENVLDDLLTVRENLYNRASLYGKTKAEITERLELVSSIMGIEDILNRRFEKLSGGQKRRAEIARAIMHDPEILLLDEPTTGLDPKTRVSVWKIIDYLREEFGMTVFLTTHYLEEAEMLCRNIGIIQSGELIENTSMKSLLSKLQFETFIFDLEPYEGTFEITGYNHVFEDKQTLSVEVERNQGVNHIFEQLSEHGIKVLSMRNKSNRLEELFLKITEEKHQVGEKHV